MKKIVYLPLDERPCNYDFPSFLLQGNKEFELKKPTLSQMGQKKKSAEYDGIAEFLRDECQTADYLILSIDLLLYGGIIPSRLHHLEQEKLTSRLHLIDELKKCNPKLIIYAFSLIMRCPQYSSDDEEPDYYGLVGRELFLLGEARNKQEIGLLSEDEILKIKEYEGKTSFCSQDFLGRRALNLQMNLKCMDLVGNSIDFLIIPQDDSSVYGFTAKDQMLVREKIKQEKLYQTVYMYPGADEVGMTLLARCINHSKKKQPTVAISYSSILGHTVIPMCEDRIVGETLKYQVLAAGCILLPDMANADVLLFINAPSGNMLGSSMIGKPQKEYAIERNIVEFCELIAYYIKKKRTVAIADIAYLNGGDSELLTILSQKKLLFELGAYAGWNTSSNTIGTTICQAVLYNYFGRTTTHEEFLALRYLEDIGYCSHVRGFVTEMILPNLGFDYFNAGEQRGVVASHVGEQLVAYFSKNYPEVLECFEIVENYQPWSRMFEVGLTVKKKQRK